MENQPAPEPNRKFPKWQFWKTRRYLVALLAFLGFFNVYCLRVNLSVAIVAMTNSYNTTSADGLTIEVLDFDWDQKTKGIVLASFFYGYICTQLLGGWLGRRIGGARVYGWGVAITAIFTLITPPVVDASVYLFIAIRVIEGIFEGVTYPCIHAVWSKWAPISERSTLGTFAFSGSFVGTVVAMPVCGFIAKAFGWEAVFYITGVVGIAWCLAWLLVVKDDPAQDPYISEEELEYIRQNTHQGHEQKAALPWSEFLTSMPVWAIVVAHTCENWGFYTLLTQLPSFLNDTLNYDIGKAGIVSALPYLTMSIIMQFGGRIADWLGNRGYLSLTNVRKAFTCGAFISQTVFMMSAAFLGTPVAVITCLVFAVGLGAFAWSGFSVNHLDIAPQYASVLMGISNTFGTMPGIISPMLTGFVVKNKTAEEWRIVFFVASTIYLFGAIFYAVFASADVQCWAQPDFKGDKKSDDKNIDLDQNKIGGVINEAADVKE